MNKKLPPIVFLHTYIFTVRKLMSTLTLNTTPQLKLSKLTHEQLDAARKKAEMVPAKQLTYIQFITLCQIYLEIEKRLDEMS